jgi:biopolymer transport protein ExbD
MEQAAGVERNLPVMIRADAQTAHQSVVKAMDAAGQLGFHRLGIVTERNEDGR